MFSPMRLHTPLGQRDPLHRHERPVEPPEPPFDQFDDDWVDVTHFHYNELTGHLVG